MGSGVDIVVRVQKWEFTSPNRIYNDGPNVVFETLESLTYHDSQKSLTEIATFGYGWLQQATAGYNRLQQATTGYNRLQQADTKSAGQGRSV